MCEEMGGTKKLSNACILWIGRIELGLHTIMVQIKREICINFAQLYLRNEVAHNNGANQAGNMY